MQPWPTEAKEMTGRACTERVRDYRPGWVEGRPRADSAP